MNNKLLLSSKPFPTAIIVLSPGREVELTKASINEWYYLMEIKQTIVLGGQAWANSRIQRDLWLSIQT
jgi:hypothetical protein